MKLFRQLFFLLSLSFVLVSCNKDEGFGGSCSIEGYVHNIVHHNKNYSFLTETVPAAEWRVFIIAGDNGAVLKDIRTNHNGMYRFDYLRKGTYTVYAYSEFPNNISRAEMVEVKVGKGLNVADPIFVHNGKGFGTSIIQGSVFATFYRRDGAFRDTGYPIEHRVYIKRAGEVVPFDDTRVGDLGIFAFEGILPGDYEVYMVCEDWYTEKPTIEEHPDGEIPEGNPKHRHSMRIKVEEDGIVYQLPEEMEGLDGEKYTFIINVSV